MNLTETSYLCLCAASFHHHFFGREFVSPHDTRPPLLISGGKWAPSWHCWDGAGRTISLLEICLWPCTKAFVWSLNYILQASTGNEKSGHVLQKHWPFTAMFFLLGNGFYFASAMCKAQVLNSSRCCQRQQGVLQTNWRLKIGAAPFRPHHCTRCYPGPLGHWRASPGSQSVSPSGGWSKSLKKSMTCSFLHDKMTRQKGHKWQICRMKFMRCYGFFEIYEVCVYIRYIYTYFKMHTYIYIYTYIIHITLFCRQRAWAKHRTSEWQKIDEIWTASSHRNNNLQTGYSYKIVFVITCAAFLQKAVLLARRCSFPKNHLHHHTCHPGAIFRFKEQISSISTVNVSLHLTSIYFSLLRCCFGSSFMLGRKKHISGIFSGFPKHSIKKKTRILLVPLQVLVWAVPHRVVVLA